MIFPSADNVATAIVTAARLCGQNPLETIAGDGSHRARTLAYAALRTVFPKALRSGLSRCCGFRSQASASAQLIYAQRAKWWCAETINTIAAALTPAAAPVEKAKPARMIVALVPPFYDVHNFDQHERALISRMLRGGADATAISATIGASPDEIAAYVSANPWIAKGGLANAGR